MAVKVHLDHVGMAFTTPGGTFRAVAPLNLSIESGRFVSLVGPSGCGKSTLFNVIAGLLAPSREGRVLIDGEDATGTIGRVGYMLQKDLLLPWRSVLDNVILGMEIQGSRSSRRVSARCRCCRNTGSRGSSTSIPIRCPAACASARRCCARCCSTPT